MGGTVIRYALRRLAAVAVMAAVVALSFSAAVASEPELRAANDTPSTSEPGTSSMLTRFRAMGTGIASMSQSTINWTQAHLSPGALKTGARRSVEVARDRWFAALFRAQCELENTLGLFEVASLDADGRARWQRIPANRPLPQRVVLLVHGLDDPGSIWDDAAPALWLGYDPAAGVDTSSATEAPKGYHVLRFDYPNDQPIGRSADLLVDALRELRAAGAREVDIIAHSMGGLIARDAISRPRPADEESGPPAELPQVHRLILLGTPNRGSHLAHLRWVMEVRDSLERFGARSWSDWPVLLTGMVDGAGEAGIDLLPGSAYLAELNSRPPLRDVRTTIVEGDFSSGYERRAIEMVEQLSSELVWLSDLGPAMTRWTRAASSHFGDGAVPDWSIALDGVDDHVVVEADHRSMITRLEVIEGVRSLLGGADRRPPAIAIILDRLSRPPLATRPESTLDPMVVPASQPEPPSGP